jgi:hypothetical protein
LSLSGSAAAAKGASGSYRFIMKGPPPARQRGRIRNA